jgi:hypothetical protein
MPHCVVGFVDWIGDAVDLHLWKMEFRLLIAASYRRVRR